MPEEPIRAAGGILLRRSPDGAIEVAIVHRPRYDDWALPKGKLHRGETEEQAALREVEEETGLRARLGRLAGRTGYRDHRDRAKTVAYFTMTPEEGAFAPNVEVDDLRWVPLEQAPALLSYRHDRDLLTRLLSEPPPL